MIIEKLLRFGRRQLHTVISRETIKPSSPTPSHLHTYNLSSLDQLSVHAFLPLILFYPNNANCSLTANDKARVLKTSLSQSLTCYYPFAGRLHTPTTPYVDCNDEGVVFLEARNDSKLDILPYINKQDETLDQLFADDLVCLNSPHSASLIGVQLNHFACGGLGLALSMSHLIGDGSTLGNFINHWASVARYGSTDHNEVLPLNPHIIHSPPTNSIQPQGQIIINKRVTRRFVFPNSKLNELKHKVVALAAAAGSTLPINNPTRVEVLTSLLYATAVTAATAKSGCFNQSCLLMPVNLRKTFVKNLAQTTVGNCFLDIMISTSHTSETLLNVVVADIKRKKVELQQVKTLEQAAIDLKSLRMKLGNEHVQNVGKKLYMCSSLCGFPYNKVDFGWGKPMAATLAFRSAGLNAFILMDTPDNDGIEAHILLEKQEMEIFENDNELLSFCRNN